MTRKKRKAVNRTWQFYSRRRRATTLAWRPVTNDAPAPLERVVIDDPVDGLDVGWRLPEQPNIFLTGRGRSYLADDIRGWLSIPTTEPVT